MIKQIEQITVWTLEKLGMYSDDSLALIMRTGFAESGFKHLEQMGGGPAIGFFQCEPATIKDICDNYLSYRESLFNKVKELGYVESESHYRIMSNISLQVAFCRLKYRRDKHSIPSFKDVENQAKYWKRVYNTELGKGTVEHFMKASKDYKPFQGDKK